MIDGDEDEGLNNGKGEDKDNVTGYTIRQIEDVLQDVNAWYGWRNNIKRRYDNATKNHLDALFNHWN